jgi:hypothetical protein
MEKALQDDQKEGKYSYLDDSVEEGQEMGDAQQDENNVEVFYLDDSLEEGQARRWEMPKRMILKWKYCTLI